MDNTNLARARLDARLNKLPNPTCFTRPHKGWIKAIREALDMTSNDLASRMGVRQQTISNLERSEQHNTIQMKTLESAAQAMNCQLIYALVPVTTLEETVIAQARNKAVHHLEVVSQHSRLEDQEVSPQELLTQLEELTARLTSQRGLWSEDLPASQ